MYLLRMRANKATDYSRLQHQTPGRSGRTRVTFWRGRFGDNLCLALPRVLRGSGQGSVISRRKVDHHANGEARETAARDTSSR